MVAGSRVRLHWPVPAIRPQGMASLGRPLATASRSGLVRPRLASSSSAPNPPTSPPPRSGPSRRPYYKPTPRISPEVADRLWSTPFPEDSLRTMTPASIPISSSHPTYPTRDESWRMRLKALGLGVALAAFMSVLLLYSDDDDAVPGKEAAERLSGIMRANGTPTEVGMKQMDQVEAFRKDLATWIWGGNGGKLIDPAVSEKATFRIACRLKYFDGTPLRDLAFGVNQAAAVDVNGDLHQFGDRRFSNSTEVLKTDARPKKTLAGKNLVAVACAGTSTVYALASNGVIYRVMMDDADKVSTEKVLFAKGVRNEKVTAIACGTDHLLALSASGKVFSAATPRSSDGDIGHGNAVGQLGNGTLGGANLDDSNLRPVVGLSSVKIADIAAGTRFSVARTRDGRVFAWGGNSFGQLGTGLPRDIPSTPKPQEVRTLWTRMRAISKPSDAACTQVAVGGSTAVFKVDREDGTEVLSCGMGLWGQLGQGGFAHVVNSPTPIGALTNLTEWDDRQGRLVPLRVGDIVMGPSHGVAVLVSGRMADSGKDGKKEVGMDALAWGLNDRGQLGRADGKKANSGSPVWIRSVIGVGEDVPTSEKREGDNAAPGDTSGVDGPLPFGRLQVAGPGWVRHKGLSWWWPWSVKVKQAFACGDGITALYPKVIR
ncbi:hypothetical protein HK101_003718 [Irineochytrium annulatum]|nr:hypothetical protein HK101_003718 [Irineochytrium annulatum]